MRVTQTLIVLSLTLATALPAENVVYIRGKEQQLQLYGTRGNAAVILSSGDLGWAGLVVHVAEFLSSAGFFVIGFNSRAYLAGFTGKGAALTPEDIPKDYRVLIEYALRDSKTRPIVAGISEGAGLSVLAATQAELKGSIQGVLALGLPNQNELGWRWQDSSIWITKKAPNEPSFMVADIIANVSPLPLAEIHSTRDEFLPIDQAKTMWTIDAANHRFSDKRGELDRCILEALGWIKLHQPSR